MNNQQNDSKLGKQWFLLVIPVSIFIIVFLYSADKFLADPSRRQAEDQVLKELREAQSGQVWDLNDSRIKNNLN